jgi:Ni/Fe-hydrogenase 1 B-type cytochrome subunit
MNAANDPATLRAYAVWDRTTRWFHWLNLICVLGLAATGTVLLNDDLLGIGNEGKVALKTVHVFIGYVFALNLGWRIVWAFVGGRHARWRAILPGGKGYWTALRQYVATFLAGRPPRYLGHNPAGRIAVTALLALLVIQALTGSLLAGTDLFLPPFGHWIAQWVAAPGLAPGQVQPYAPQLYDAVAYAQMRAFRGPIVELHETTFFILLVVTGLHIAAVVITELRERNNIISAMFTGRKTFDAPPRDGGNAE